MLSSYAINLAINDITVDKVDSAVVVAVVVVAVKLITSGNRHSVAEAFGGIPISAAAGEPMVMLTFSSQNVSG